MSTILCSRRTLVTLAVQGIQHALDAIPRLGSDGCSLTHGAYERMVANVAQWLSVANVAGISECYREAWSAREADEFRLEAGEERAAKALPALHVVKLCHFYEYQCVDWGGWASSRQRTSIAALEAHWVRRLPGYSEAPWGL